jgi:hypothetical protein
MSQKPYTIYDLETGEARQTGFTPEAQIGSMKDCIEPGQGFIQKAVNPLTHRVSKGKRVIKRRKADLTRESQEEAWRALKAKRNHLLVESDKTQVPDAPFDHEAWREYRQALRELPQNTQDPLKPNWPEPPQHPWRK